ncbi:efflux RND transporter permease subunit [Hyphomicrobium sp. MC1]|uniref:efflux RND transporter permease subunit n=1 Tax=Hyphomicrobium sp. (strain MC1) TaxID=717785 RepID=UPI000213EFEC|nr:efflux RND transporter permease subunit [Hyphomicrobium sp. MC1]CCB66697.1 protein of unknown function [Hyphomicrobium sp. MC1]
MPDFRITARQVLSATTGASEDAALRLDAGGITHAPRGIFGKIVQFFTGSDRAGTKKLLSGLSDDFQWRYGGKIGPDALKLARAAHDASGNSTPLTRGQIHTAEVFARALTKNNERHEVADTAMRYAPGALGFAKVAREADVNPNSLSAIQKQHYTELLRYQVGMAAGGPVVNRKAQLDIAIGTLRHVARMDAAEIEASNKWLTDVRDAGIKLARDIAKGGKPELLLFSLDKFLELVMERPNDIGLTRFGEQHGEKDDWVKVALGIAISSAASAMPAQEARDLYKDAMTVGGSGRTLMFITARDREEQAVPIIAEGKPLSRYPAAELSERTHYANRTLLRALGERGGVESAEQDITALERAASRVPLVDDSSSGVRTAMRLVEASIDSESQRNQLGIPANDNNGEAPVVPATPVVRTTDASSASAPPNPSSEPAAIGISLDTPSSHISSSQAPSGSQAASGVANTFQAESARSYEKLDDAGKLFHDGIMGVVRDSLLLDPLQENAFKDRVEQQLANDSKGKKPNDPVAWSHVRAMLISFMDEQFAVMLGQPDLREQSVKGGAKRVKQQIGPHIDMWLSQNADLLRQTYTNSARRTAELTDLSSALRKDKRTPEAERIVVGAINSTGNGGHLLAAREPQLDALEREVQAVQRQIRKMDSDKATNTPAVFILGYSQDRERLVNWSRSLVRQMREIRLAVEIETKGFSRSERELRKLYRDTVMDKLSVLPPNVRQRRWNADAFKRGDFTSYNSNADTILNFVAYFDGLDAGVGIAQGEGHFNERGQIEQALNAFDRGPYPEALEQTPLSNGGKVNRLFWDEATNNTYTIFESNSARQLYDGPGQTGEMTAEARESGARHIAEQLHEFVGNPAQAETISNILHRGVIAPLEKELSKIGISFQDDTVLINDMDTHLTEGEQLKDRLAFTLTKNKKSDSISVSVQYSRPLRRVPLEAGAHVTYAERWLDPKQSYLRLNCNLTIWSNGRVGLTRTPSYSYYLKEAASPPPDQQPKNPPTSSPSLTSTGASPT